MQLSHTVPLISATFDEPNLIASAGLAPALALAGRVGIADLTDEWLTVSGSAGANAGCKVVSLVAGMAAGAACIDDMALLRRGAMGCLFDRVRVRCV